MNMIFQITKKVKKNMDHQHESGYMRFIVCQRCNGFLRYRDEEHSKVLDEVKISYHNLIFVKIILNILLIIK